MSEHLVLPMNAGRARTDPDFRPRFQEEHHKGESLFEKLLVDVIGTLPSDYMHMTCIMKKRLSIWQKVGRPK